MGSIVATETSTVTFISVPGVAFTGNWTFLQLVMGYMVGRIVVSIIFVPAYFRGELLTVYQILGHAVRRRRQAAGRRAVPDHAEPGGRRQAVRDGPRAGGAAAGDARHRTTPRAPGCPGLDPTVTILVASVLVMGLTTIVYTYLGGMSAVIWTDVIQLVIYLVGAGLAAGHPARRAFRAAGPRWFASATAAGKFTRLRLHDGRHEELHVLVGVIGGAFLTTATHGTDQLMVQRYLCSSSPRQARVALLASGAVVFAQFVAVPADRLDALRVSTPGTRRPRWRRSRWAAASRATASSRTSSSPTCPPGVVGLVVAAVFAAAMSTLSSSLNSSSATAMADFYMPMRKAQRRALPACVAVADGVLGRRADLGRAGGHPVLDPRRRRGARHRVVHQRHHPRRVPPRHVRAARAAALGVRRASWPARR